MKKWISLLSCIFFMNCLTAQVETRFFPEGDAYKYLDFLNDLPEDDLVKLLPAVDNDQLIAEDNLLGTDSRPFRFGKGFEENITQEKGTIYKSDNGLLWRYRVVSEGAYSINFVFKSLQLADGAELYVVNNENTMVFGPVMKNNVKRNSKYSSDIIMGDDVSIIILEKGSIEFLSKITISKIVHGFRDTYSSFNLSSKKSSSCYTNVTCDSNLDVESDAVAQILINGVDQCTGALIMTANKSFKSYFLTAFHCGDLTGDKYVLESADIAIIEDFTFKFNYKKTTCLGSIYTISKTYDGASLITQHVSTDLILLELDDSFIGNTEFSWLGWDISGDDPTSATYIHHPKTNDMKVSYDTTTLDETNSNGNPGNNYWLSSLQGYLNEGSSGGPLLDQNKRIVGSLHKSTILGCGSGYTDAVSGCLYRAWSAFDEYLDPCESGDETVNTSRSPYLDNFPDYVCTSPGKNFYVRNLPSNCISIGFNKSSNLTQYYGGFYGGYGFAAIKATSNGLPATIGVTVYTNTCGTLNIPQKTLWAGKPAQPITNPTGYPTYQMDLYDYKTIVTSSALGASSSSYSWSCNGSLDAMSSSSGSTFTVFAEDIGNGNFYVNSSNECGSSPTGGGMVYVSTGGGGGQSAEVFPNPAKSNIKLILNEPDFPESNGLKSFGNYNNNAISDLRIVKIYNNIGKMVYTGNLENNQLNLNVDTWLRGVYHYKVSVNSSSESTGTFILE